MRWNVPYDGDWHRWLAWYPVRCCRTNILVWLEPVDRRFFTVMTGGMLLREHKIPDTKVKP